MDRVRIHRQKLAELREIVENVGKNPGSINDTDFRRRMSEVNESVNVLLNDAREAVGKFVFPWKINVWCERISKRPP